MLKDYGTSLKELRVDGGMTANNLLMQLQANLTGVKVIKPKMAESTALGAAMVAGAAVGIWDMKETVEIPTEIWEPTYTENERDMRYSRWKMAVERSMGWDV